jgi:hypothetical protein
MNQVHGLSGKKLELVSGRTCASLLTTAHTTKAKFVLVGFSPKNKLKQYELCIYSICFGHWDRKMHGEVQHSLPVETPSMLSIQNKLLFPPTN